MLSSVAAARQPVVVPDVGRTERLQGGLPARPDDQHDRDSFLRTTQLPRALLPAVLLLNQRLSTRWLLLRALRQRRTAVVAAAVSS